MDATTPHRRSGSPAAPRWPLFTILVALGLTAACSSVALPPAQLRTLARHGDPASADPHLADASHALAGVADALSDATARPPRTLSEPSPIVPPFSLENVISTFGDCRPGGRQHRGLDIAGTGELRGLGEPIVTMVDAEVTFIGRPEDDPDSFGRPDRRGGTVERGHHVLPREIEVDGYGTVYPFTRTAGSWRSGTVVVTRARGGPLDGYVIRYMHLGAVHPELQVGDLVVAGQEIALMGGTGVQSSVPHVHIDIEDLEGDRVDVAPLLGLEPDTSTCRAKRRKKKKRKG